MEDSRDRFRTIETTYSNTVINSATVNLSMQSYYNGTVKQYLRGQLCSGATPEGTVATNFTLSPVNFFHIAAWAYEHCE